MGQVGHIHKLNYLDVTRTSHILYKTVLESSKWVNLGSGKCTELSLMWNQLITSSCFEAWDFILKKSVHRTGSVFILKKSIELVLYPTLNYFKEQLYHLGHKWVSSRLLCGLWVNRCDPLSTLIHILSFVWGIFKKLPWSSWYFTQLNDQDKHPVVMTRSTPL